MFIHKSFSSERSQVKRHRCRCTAARHVNGAGHVASAGIDRCSAAPSLRHRCVFHFQSHDSAICDGAANNSFFIQVGIEGIARDSTVACNCESDGAIVSRARLSKRAVPSAAKGVRSAAGRARRARSGRSGRRARRCAGCA